MENDQIAEADARLAKHIDAGLDKGVAKGHDAVAAVYAAAPPYQASEDTPLLRQENTRRRDSEDAGSPPPPNAWSYTTDFDHLPWWRRPSVSLRCAMGRIAS